jgi:hypothetical protein
VRLILADWLSINQTLEEMKQDAIVKESEHRSKCADIIYNGRDMNVCLIADLQSYNLAALGLKADRNSLIGASAAGCILGAWMTGAIGNKDDEKLTEIVTNELAITKDELAELRSQLRESERRRIDAIDARDKRFGIGVIC